MRIRKKNGELCDLVDNGFKIGLSDHILAQCAKQLKKISSNSCWRANSAKVLTNVRNN